MNDSKKIKLREFVKGKKSHFFKSEGVDELISICMTLAQELWVVKEQTAIYEEFITKKLNISETELSNFKLSNKKREVLDNESHEFINRIFFTLNEITKETNNDSNEPKLPKIP
tara:strand:- start:551 stop:892 length:342 start_codon:yes stop_codon:yes gene_type:complete